MSLVAVILAKYLIYFLAAWVIVATLVIFPKPGIGPRLIWGLKILTSLILFAGVTWALHQYFPSTRPYILDRLEPLLYLPTSYSFPSGHAGQAAIFASFIFALSRPWGILAFILAFLVGAGRVLVGAHFIQDVLGGLIIGTVISVIVLKLGRKIK